MAEFDEALEGVKTQTFAHSLIECDLIAASDLLISTITFLFFTTFDMINIENLRQLWGDGIEPTRMRNCIVRKYAIDARRKCAIKIFSNGRLHITGCTSAGLASEYIQKCLDEMRAGGVEGAATDFQVQMINSNFSFQYAIDLYALGRILGASSVPYHYNKDHHHALRFKSPDNVSILVFMSGSVIITGGKIPSFLFTAFKTIVDIIEREFHNGIILRDYKKRPRYVKKVK